MDISSAVVLAAGEGERLHPLTKNRPKPMLPAANRPILEYVLDAITTAGIDDIHIVVGYKRDRVQSHFGSTHRDVPITYHHQRKQLGTGHALLRASAAIDSDFLVVNGDQIIHHDMVSDVLAAHSDEDVATLAAVESDKAPNYGAVRVEEEYVEEFIEKPRTEDYSLLNAGVYAFSPSFFSEIEATERHGGELSLADTLSRLVRANEPVRGVLTGGIWRDATYPWDLLSLARTVLTETGFVDVPEQSENVYVDPSAVVHEDATVQGPVVIGADTLVGPQAVIGPNTAVGQNVTVGAGAVVHGSVIDSDTRIGSNATVVDSVTGQSSALGAGVTIPGGRSDVRIGTTVHRDCQLGSVVADRTTVGGGATLLPGTLIGPNASVLAGSRVSKNVGEGVEVTN